MSDTDTRPHIVVIVGPTAVGKTDCAIRLSQEFYGEIINADSMQVYKGMDVGTAKPDANQQKIVRFHLIDVVEPDQTFSAGAFAVKAKQTISDILQRRKVPIVCGGTGLYCKALLSGIVRTPRADYGYRAKLESMEDAALGALYQMLADLDPDRARELKKRDKLRIIRALEILHLTGTKMSELTSSHGFRDISYSSIKIGLFLPKSELEQNIRVRVDKMFAKGWIEEVIKLREIGYDSGLPSMKALGYSQISDLIEGKISLEEAKEKIVSTTKKYAKRQFTWFKADHDIAWYKYPDDYEKINQICKTFLLK